MSRYRSATIAKRRAGVLEHVLEHVATERGVERNLVAADPRGAEPRRGGVHGVREHDGDAVAGRDTETAQRVRPGEEQRVRLGVRQRLVVRDVDEELGVGCLGGPQGDHLGQRDLVVEVVPVDGRRHQKVAIGFAGLPVPPSRRRGASVKWNS